MYFGIKLSVCQECGKEFVAAPYHVYKNSKGFFCCWSCLNKNRNDKEKIKKEKMIEKRAKIEKNKKENIKRRTVSYHEKEKKSVLQFTELGDFVARHDSLKSAAESVGVTPSAISNCCHGKKSNVLGYVWKFENGQTG